MSKFRRDLYRAARIMGDVEAVQKGRVPQRIANHLIGRLVNRATRRLWR